MTDPQRTLIAVRSGSMEAIKSDTEGGFVFLGANMAARGRRK